MTRRPKDAVPIALPALAKCPSGIPGLDSITSGGLPRGRTTVVCGGPGTGKTLFGAQFLVRGIVDYDEPGVFVCFEELPADLTQNFATLGFDLTNLVTRKKLAVESVQIEQEINLDVLFSRLATAITIVGAKRVVIDTIDPLIARAADPRYLREELLRLLHWLKDRGVTSIVTGERGATTLTRNGLEEYTSDCVIALDQRVMDRVATRLLRIVKYRGSPHGTNEYPFLIDRRGFTVVPITAVSLNYAASEEAVPTGIARLDDMLGPGGVFRGSIVLVTGGAGTGKTSLAAHFVAAACERGERALFCCFEEAPAQVERNMRSIGIDLGGWVRKDLLRFFAIRPASSGLEVHLAMKLATIDEFQPRVIVLDPVTSYETAGTPLDAQAMMMRLVDHLKTRAITALFTSVADGVGSTGQVEGGVSSLIDTWLVLRNLEQSGERVRTVFIAKSRGMSHTSQVRELLLSSQGVDLAHVFVAPDGRMLTGSARAAQEVADRAATVGVGIAKLGETASSLAMAQSGSARRREDGDGRADGAANATRRRSGSRTSLAH
jgi:circadian clock protein KaiC